MGSRRRLRRKRRQGPTRRCLLASDPKRWHNEVKVMMEMRIGQAGDPLETVAELRGKNEQERTDIMAAFFAAQSQQHAPLRNIRRLGGTWSVSQEEVEFAIKESKKKRALIARTCHMKWSKGARRSFLSSGPSTSSTK